MKAKQTRQHTVTTTEGTELTICHACYQRAREQGKLKLRPTPGRPRKIQVDRKPDP